MSLVCGIDPGLRGGIAFVADGLKAWADPMPIMPSLTSSGGEIDARSLYERLYCVLHSEEGQRINEIDLVCLEKEHAFPLSSRKSTFTFGVVCGKIKAVLEILNIPVIEVLPMTWKKQVLKDTSKDKQMAIAWCRARYPGVDLYRGETKAHDGMADALALAEYGRQHLLGRDG